MINSTGKACYFTCFVDVSDDSFCKTDVDQHMSEERQKLPQMKHCTQMVILISYGCCTEQKLYIVFNRNKFELFLKLCAGRNIYTQEENKIQSI